MKKADYILWYSSNPWRKWCNRWWSHWIKLPLLLWDDLKDGIVRALWGYAPRDTYDMISYHAGLTLGLLKVFNERHMGYAYGMTPEEYEAKLDLAIDGWSARVELYSDKGWDYKHQDYQEWRKPLEARVEIGMKAFYEIYDSLWI